MIGIAFDNREFFENFPEDGIFKNTALQIDAEIVSHTVLKRKLKKLSYCSLAVRNPVNSRLNRLILESPLKLRLDYLESMAGQCQIWSSLGAEKILIDFDMGGVFENPAAMQTLLPLLSALSGIMYEHKLVMELLFRLPRPDMDDFFSHAAMFCRSNHCDINFAADMHVHEAGFERSMILDAFLPVQYDTGSMNFIYDAALGNKINSTSLKKIIDHFSNKGAQIDFYLCPSGEIDFHAVEPDIIEWINILQQPEE